LKSDVGSTFNTNILKIALNFNEDNISAVLVAHYPVVIDMGIVDYAI
jgi:hypothetical protein